MYFIELLVKKFKKKPEIEPESVEEKEEITEETACEHVFMPIDSTGEYLACRNCGLVINKKQM